jgi:predicted TIM-barrel fold metal-dependent hydrolase
MPQRFLNVDADGHVLEPRNTWIEYIDPAFRERAIRIDIDNGGDELLLIDGRPLEVMRNGLAGLGGINLDPVEALDRSSGRLRYEDGCPPGGYDPAARLQVMDEEGIDIALLYPTIGICWEGHVTDPALATAYARAYNRYIVDFCSHDPHRLVPVAHVSLIDAEGATDEVVRACGAGCKAIYLSPDAAARGGRNLSDPAFDRFWSTVEELDVPIGFHVIVRDNGSFRMPTLNDAAERTLYGFAFLAIDVMAAFTEMLVTGVFEQHPRLRCTILECGASWIASWLDRLDHKFEVVRNISANSLKPSEYFFRQCIVSADPDETGIAPIIEALGADYFVWASDYPHIDASFGVVGEIRSRLDSLPEETQAKVLGLNAQRFYGLEVPAWV